MDLARDAAAPWVEAGTLHFAARANLETGEAASHVPAGHSRPCGRELEATGRLLDGPFDEVEEHRRRLDAYLRERERRAAALKEWEAMSF